LCDYCVGDCSWKKFREEENIDEDADDDDGNSRSPVSASRDDVISDVIRRHRKVGYCTYSKR